MKEKETQYLTQFHGINMQDGSDSNGTTDVGDACNVEENDKDDDSSTEEMYSDFKRSGTYFGM